MENISIWTLLTVVVFPIGWYWVKKFERLFEKLDERIDNISVDFATKAEVRREIDRTNKIVSEIFENKADKDLVNSQMSGLRNLIGDKK